MGWVRRRGSGPCRRRILATHHPLHSADSGRYTVRAWYHRYQQRVVDAVAESRVAVHLALSGHDHYLAATAAADGALLNVIAGSGSSFRDEARAERGLLVRESSLGFARVDATPDRLRVALLGVDATAASRPIACFAIRTDAHYRREPDALCRARGSSVGADLVGEALGRQKVLEEKSAEGAAPW